MSLLEKIDQDLKLAMIAKDPARLNTLRFLKSALKYVMIDKPGAPFTDADALLVIQKQIKQRRESVAQFDQGSRSDLSAKELAEIAILEAYLPKQISDTELRSFIEGQVREQNASGKKDFGRLMKICTEKLAGGADNKRISEILGSLLK